MRIPLEILRIILTYAARQDRSRAARTTIFKLRLVSRTFDEEILSLYFSNKRLKDAPRLVTTNTWSSLPWEISRKFLYFRIRWSHLEPSLFAYLFLPVLERQEKGLGIAEDDSIRRNLLLREWLELPLHDKKMAYVVAHKDARFECLVDGFYAERENAREDGTSYAREEWREMQIEEDQKFGLMCLAIIKTNEQDLIRILQSPRVVIDRLSLCFGSTLLTYAIKRGSIPILKLILRHGHLSSRPDLDDLFRAALSRDDATERIDLLVEHFMTVIAPMTQQECGNIIDTFFTKRRNAEYDIIVDRLVHWLGDLPSSPSKPRLLHRAFNSGIRSGRIPVVTRLVPFINVNARYGSGSLLPIQTALLADKEYPDLLRLLITLGADVNPEPEERGTWPEPPIFIAALRGYVKSVEILLEAGADPRSKFGQLPLLHLAESGGTFREIEELLERFGWDREDLEDKDGKEIDYAKGSTELRRQA
ncbi:hypothetical protein BU26DRAFT_564217 [Trematosphaeria pertusa]|uniref:Uncharacterized protein n=1 Tax=Trematosphaeria pertusa TaxID=390896 RepID=A0A6A6IIX6_9PLEO|nr:uncharacterized protein BU26DRAFT_564217 [Trematosphaeria pertusa]KAF2250361.1 hypothetical protein BU26DRAFT_564217 [Trematosphaeria pertusa]